MIQVKPVDDTLPNDPIEIDTEALLKEIGIEVGVERVLRAIERRSSR